MKRLTDKKIANAERVEYERRLKNGYPRNILEEWFLKLASYEDTDLEPDEVLTGKELAEIACAINLLKEYQSLGTLARLKQLAHAEKDGRLLRHGWWIYNKKGNLYRCSVCLKYPSFIPTHCHISDYCPNCGAKMDFTEAALEKREEEDDEID